MERIIFVDDDAEVLELNRRFFTKEGYEVKAFTSPKKALQYLKKEKADCIIMDVMMPEMDGFSACQRLRTFSQIPVIFLTGRTQEKDKITGLMLGAEDYVEKPYSMKELSARIMVQIRRNRQQGKESDNVLSFPSICIDLTKRKVILRGQDEILLTNREFDLLTYLALRPGETVSFEELGKHMWTHYSENDRRSIMVTMSRLRKKLQETTGNLNLIETVWSVGYKFMAV